MNLNIIIPHYHSSFCLNNCMYCGFKKNNQIIPRKRLTDEEFIAEIDLILSWGYRTIEFVYASDPQLDILNIAKRIGYVKELGDKRNMHLRIGLNADPLRYEDYLTLKKAGLDFFVIWMETYSREKYAFWHDSKSPKYDFDFRYNSYSRAIDAGLKNYGMGILFGLNNWHEDVMALVEHGKILEQEYGISPYIIGLPRFKKANSVVDIDNYILPVNDEEYMQACKMYKENFPKTMLFINTREKLDFNLNFCGDNDLFTIDCGTSPGAYLYPSIVKNGIEQFHTYQYNREVAIRKIKEKGFTPIFDW